MIIRILLVYLTYFHCGIFIAYAQGIWTQKANFSGVARQEAIGFSIGNKAYIGTGWNGVGSCLQDFWEWDQVTNTWSQKANFGGGNRQGAFHFSIGTKGYIGMGWNCSSDQIDFWEWDQATNTWSQKANFPGSTREDGSSFSIGTKGYIGTGVNTNNNTNPSDFWEWDQATNIWTQQANFGGAPRLGTTCRFSIGTKGYIGLGANNSLSVYYNDFWEWDQTTNAWTQKANFAGTARCYPSGFSICTKGYIGTGYDGTAYKQDLWEWDQATNTWTQQTSLPAPGRFAATGFSIGNKGYLVTGGIYSSGQFLNDFWEFVPNPCNTLSVTSTSQNVLCNGQCTGMSTANPSNGISPYTYSWSNGQTTSTATGLCAGTYTVVITDSLNNTATNTITITQPATGISVSISTTDSSISTGDSIQLTATGGGTYQWSPSIGLSCTTCANPFATPLQTTIYCVQVTDSNGCTNSTCISIEIECGNIYVPNAFSPNNDAENDLECVFGDCIQTILFTIYDRWGEKVFETTDQKICWDGMYKGKKEDSAVFAYSLEATLTSGKVIKQKGNISLVR